MVRGRLAALNAVSREEPQSTKQALLIELGFGFVQNGAWAVVKFGYMGKNPFVLQSFLRKHGNTVA